MSWLDNPKPQLPTPGPCPQCGRESYKTRKLQRQWAESGHALCHSCQRRFDGPTNRLKISTPCPACGRNVRTPGLCSKCKEAGHVALTIDDVEKASEAKESNR